MRYSTTPASQSRPRVFSDHTDSVATPADIAELASDRARLGPFQPQNPAGAGYYWDRIIAPCVKKSA